MTSMRPSAGRSIRTHLTDFGSAVQLRRSAAVVEAAQAAANKAGRLLDKAASKGIIHKNQAANRKSGVQSLVNKMA